MFISSNNKSCNVDGALFRARKVTIWTYVDGVYSANPRKEISTTSLHLEQRFIVNEQEEKHKLETYVKGFAAIDNLALVNVEGTGLVGVPSTSSAIFDVVKDVGANVIMISYASSKHSVCFVVPEKEVKAVVKAL
ncbi:hypothetical protein L6452_14458 [Arctium lappa]|uniref:Uncharacterized protein n=1 Tax=Arctium lappa TaxID=4217 RepID=A0ACB9CL40_ARCLA|nr:hypothetical protein L6452_14458 [Arctium lappa]